MVGARSWRGLVPHSDLVKLLALIIMLNRVRFTPKHRLTILCMMDGDCS